MNYSDNYKILQERLHSDRPDYGTSGAKYADYILQLSKSLNTRDILDYGCGKSTLQKSLPFPIKQYDPFITEFSALPHPSALVVCTDVMEHIEELYLNETLEEISSLTLQMVFFQIATGPAKKVLADGRNAHLIQQHPNWWISKLLPFFDLQNFAVQTGGFIIIGTPLTTEEPNA